MLFVIKNRLNLLHLLQLLSVSIGLWSQGVNANVCPEERPCGLILRTGTPVTQRGPLGICLFDCVRLDSVATGYLNTGWDCGYDCEDSDSLPTAAPSGTPSISSEPSSVPSDEPSLSMEPSSSPNDSSVADSIGTDIGIGTDYKVGTDIIGIGRDIIGIDFEIDSSAALSSKPSSLPSAEPSSLPSAEPSSSPSPAPVEPNPCADVPPCTYDLAGQLGIPGTPLRRRTSFFFFRTCDQVCAQLDTTEYLLTALGYECGYC